MTVSRPVRDPPSPRAPGAGDTIGDMAREQRWPDEPGGFHAPHTPKSAVDISLNCCAVILIAGVIGFLVFAFWIVPHTVRIPF